MTLHQAIETAKAKAAGNAKWTRAIERAADGLQSGELIVTLLAHDALVTTATGQHRVNGRCDCDAAKFGHRECVHRAAKRLVEMMEEAELAEAAAKRCDILISDIKRIWAETQTTPLADELMARFKKNKLEMLSIDFLVAVKAAIA